MRWRKAAETVQTGNCPQVQQALEKRGVTATVRRKLGPDIDAACGQLRQRQLKEDKKEQFS